MISSKLVLTIPVILAAMLSEDLLSCPAEPRFFLCAEYLHGLAAEISLIFIPSLLALLAVITVSIFAFKLQLRLAREIQPTVNLPPPPPANVIQLETRNSTGSRQTGRNTRDDIKIFNIEDGEVEESQPRQPQNQNNKDRNEAQEDDFEVRRVNSDPNSFFRVSCREEISEAASPTCFQPLSVLVERIMMLNIAALILVFIFTMTNSVRLYFIVTREECDERSIVFIRLVKFLSLFLCVLYVIVIRKKLCN